MKRVTIIGKWLVMIGVLLVSVPSMSQIFGATGQKEQNAFGASAPTASFQSTSTLPATGSTYSANPTLNADGTATYQGAVEPAAAPKHPGHIRKAGGVDPTDDDDFLPLGDAVIPLMLIACAYAVCKVRSRRKGQIEH